MEAKDEGTLFKKKKDKKIEAFDLFDQKHKRDLANFQFRASAYGILRKGDKILVQRHPDLKTFGLPGGGIEIEETIKEGLVREYKEETGLLVEQGKLLYAMDDFFTYRGQDAHGILLFYEVKKLSGVILKEGNQFDTGEVRFINLTELEKTNVQRVYWPVIKLLKSKKIEAE